MPNKPGDDAVMLSDGEMEIVRTYARLHGMSELEAANKLLSDAIAEKFGKNTGMRRAKVYPLPKKH